MYTLNHMLDEVKHSIRALRFATQQFCNCHEQTVVGGNILGSKQLRYENLHHASIILC